MREIFRVNHVRWQAWLTLDDDGKLIYYVKNQGIESSPEVVTAEEALDRFPEHAKAIRATLEGERLKQAMQNYFGEVPALELLEAFAAGWLAKKNDDPKKPAPAVIGERLVNNRWRRVRRKAKV